MENDNHNDDEGSLPSSSPPSLKEEEDGIDDEVKEADISMVTDMATRSSCLKQQPSDEALGDSGTIELGKGVSMDAHDFVDCFRPMIQSTPKGEELRQEAWQHCDSNQNGYISLAECDLWIKETLKSNCVNGQDGERIWKRYRRCYIHAFNRAKDVSEETNLKAITKNSTTTSHAYIDRKEFRIMIGYLCVYVVMYDAFQKVDGGTRGEGDLGDEHNPDDLRIEFYEWLASYENVTHHTLVGLQNIEDPKVVFGEMDIDNGGVVLLGEWCQYLAKKEVQANTMLGSFLNISTMVKEERHDTKKDSTIQAASSKDTTTTTNSTDTSPKDEAKKESALKPDCRFKGEAMVTLGTGVSQDARDFVDSFRVLGQENDEAKKLRNQEWDHCDFNSNGLISLAECDLWIKEILKSKCIQGDEGERIWKRYRRSYIHAFNRAKNVSEETDIDGMQTATTDDFVEKNEFRLMVGYLCVYVVMYDAFQMVDGGKRGEGILGDDTEDLRIELNEWLTSYKNVTDHTLVGLKDIDDPKVVFDEMDVDNGGLILLSEWCRYLAKKEVEAKTFLGSLLDIASTAKAATHEKGKSPVKASPKKIKEEEAPPKSALKPIHQFTGKAMIKLGKGISMDAKDFVDCFRVMGQKNDKSKKLRVQAWHHCDYNGNGVISLAECDLWVKETLKSKCISGDEGERIWKRYRRSYIHAFNRAKNVSEENEIAGMTTATTDDFVDKKEFRIMIAYLCVYVVMYDAFQMVDGGKRGEGILGDDTEDLRIELDEWLASYENVTDHTLVGLKDVDDPEAIFVEMDVDNGGMVLLGEWCRFLAKKEVESDTVLGSFLNISTVTRENTHSKKEKSPIKSSPTTKRSTTTTHATLQSSLKPSCRFTGKAMVKLGKGVSQDARDFVDSFREMAQKNDASKKLRMREWNHCDFNANGLISLAECDLWVKEVLISKCVKGEGERIWKRYRRSYLHAFNRAKNVSEGNEIEGMKTATTDDYVDKKEFRIMIAYLCVYVVMYDAFQMVDGGKRGEGILGDDTEDLRIELDEWLASYENVTDHTLVGLKDVDDPEAIFVEMDVDNGGMVLLGEWCRYLAKKEVEAKTILGSFLDVTSITKAATNGKGQSSIKTVPPKKVVWKEAAPKSALKPTQHFTGQAMVKLGKGVSMDAKDFVDCFRVMGQKNDKSKKLRMQAWHHCDYNGNGVISLAECDLWVKETLKSKCTKRDEGERIWKRYRRSYIHAFNRAKNVSEETKIAGMETATSNDYVNKKEFRIMIAYLCVYVVMYDAFQMVDGGKRGEGILGDDTEDLRIELDEWVASYKNVMDHTLVGLKNIDDPKVVFGEMDVDNGGMVLLGEWCRFLAKKEVEAKTVLGSFLDISNLSGAK